MGFIFELTRTAGKATPSLEAIPSTSAFISTSSLKIASCLFRRVCISLEEVSWSHSYVNKYNNISSISLTKLKENSYEIGTS